MKVTEYPAVTDLADNNVVLLDGPQGTKTMTIENLREQLFNAIPEMHNQIFRGKDLGTELTSTQLSKIRDGSFDDLFVGDFWTIDDRVYRIADIDYYLGTGDQGEGLQSHHLVVVPDNSLYNQRFNANDTNANGYFGSEMYKSGLNSAKSIISTAFPSAVLSHRIIVSNAVTNGNVTGYAWVDSTVDLMNECMVYGHPHFLSGPYGTTVPSIYTESKTQLALFRIAPKFINAKIENDDGAMVRSSWWLRDPISTQFSGTNCVGFNGSQVLPSVESTKVSVRPAFLVG